MPVAASPILCDQCGAALVPGQSNLGCLNCLLTGGLEPVEVPRLYQHYEIAQRPDGSPWELGRGAMGATYRAVDVNLRVPVALKVIASRLSAHPEARARFLREARAAARLRHPNVASVFHFGVVSSAGSAGDGAAPPEDTDGQCFYAMELVEGETLAARLRRRGPLPPRFVLAIAREVTHALAAAEKRGLVHRDLKPSNIMLTTAAAEADSAPQGTGGETWVKVIDFGLAKAVSSEDADGASGLTDGPATRSAFLGTPQFASPEQFEHADVDVRSDIFSLGVTLWYLLTGEMPFDGRSLAEVHDRQRNRPLPLAQLEDRQTPTPIVALLAEMLAADPDGRPPSAGALGERIEGCLALLQTPAAAGRRAGAAWFGSWRRAAVVAALSSLGLAGLSLAVYPALRARVGSSPVLAAAETPDKSIAVLPLKNLSEDPADAFFADGIQDDVLTSLAKIGELRVISQASVQSYKGQSPLDLPQVGARLGVSHLLEGSVQRKGGRMLVKVNLIGTRDGRLLWSERYDRALSDALTLQSEVATEIAGALRARLSTAERARVEIRPTNNPDAYVLYLRAREYDTRPSYLRQDTEVAVRLYKQAIALDPNFALAHAQLSQALAVIYLDNEPTDEMKANAFAEAREALRLQPDSGEGHLVLGLCYYYTERRYDEALEELEIAARLLPNNATPEIGFARVCRRQGRWRDAIAAFKRVLARDPGNAEAAREMAQTRTAVRDWPTAVRDWDRSVALSPDLLILRGWRGYASFWRNGDVTRMDEAADSVPLGQDPDARVTWLRMEAALVRRDYDAAERAVSLCRVEVMPSTFLGLSIPKAYLRGCVALARGDAAGARGFFEAARPIMEAEAASAPEHPSRCATLGLLYAYLGRGDEAIRLGRRAVELRPSSVDAYDYPIMASYLALIYARTGEQEQAIDLLEKLLTMPGPVDWYVASVTFSELRLRWQWDPLRANPRFRKLLAGPEPRTVY